LLYPVADNMRQEADITHDNTHTSTDNTSDDTRTNTDSTVRVTVVQAAEILGLTEGAVRQRLKRGTLQADKDEDGSVYVLLDRTHVRTYGDSMRTNDDITDDNTAGQSLVVARLENEVEWLRREVERKDTIIMSLSQSIAALEAPSEPRESSVAPSDSTDRAETTADDDTGKSRSWLRRFFDL
jgi:hypothetical protein